MCKLRQINKKWGKSDKLSLNNVLLIDANKKFNAYKICII